MSSREFLFFEDRSESVSTARERTEATDKSGGRDALTTESVETRSERSERRLSYSSYYFHHHGVSGGGGTIPILPSWWERVLGGWSG